MFPQNSKRNRARASSYGKPIKISEDSLHWHVNRDYWVKMGTPKYGLWCVSVICKNSVCNLLLRSCRCSWLSKNLEWNPFSCISCKTAFAERNTNNSDQYIRIIMNLWVGSDYSELFDRRLRKSSVSNIVWVWKRLFLFEIHSDRIINKTLI